MAWPPAGLPTNRTNATPQTNTHPADHNAVNAAMNDTVARVQAIETGAVEVTSSRFAEQATLCFVIRSAGTPNDIKFRWDPPNLYFTVDDVAWWQLSSTLVGAP